MAEVTIDYMSVSLRDALDVLFYYNEHPRLRTRAYLDADKHCVVIQG